MRNWNDVAAEIAAIIGELSAERARTDDAERKAELRRYLTALSAASVAVKEMIAHER